jgi:hypothetical protein
VVARPFAEEGSVVRHSPAALAGALIDLVRETSAR